MWALLATLAGLRCATHPPRLGMAKDWGFLLQGEGPETPRSFRNEEQRLQVLLQGFQLQLHVSSRAGSQRTGV